MKPISFKFLKKSGIMYFVIILVQALCVIMILANMFIDYFQFRSAPIAWGLYEILEIMSVVGLVLGLIISFFLVKKLRGDYRKSLSINDALRRDFSAFIASEFTRWGLSSSEMDVAWGMIKGYSNKEIGDARHTAEGTVKVQASGVLAKAGVENRQQFVGLFLEELIGQQGEK